MNRPAPRIVATLAIALLLALGATAAESLSLLLQKGIYAEETERNLDAAIRIYEQITAEGAANRALAAQAQYRLAVCYQKKGNNEQAIAALNDLLKQIPADAALAPKAREALSLLGAAPSDTVTIRRVPAPASHLYSVSRDGRFILYGPKDTYDLAVYETATGKTWTAFRGSRDALIASAIFSPDGRRIACTRSSIIHVAGIDGSEAKQVYKIAEPRVVWVAGWSPIGDQIVVRHWLPGSPPASGLGILDLGTGKMRELRCEPQPYARFAPELSATGRYLAYQAGSTKSRRQILLIDLETGNETTLVEREVETVIGWTPGDTKVLFTSDRTGAMSLWAIAVRNGNPVGEPELIRANFGDPAAVAVTTDGKVYYSERQPTDLIHLAAVDFAVGEVIRAPRRATLRFPGAQTAPVWSDDGQRLMIGIQRGGHFLSVALSSGEETDFPAGTAFGRYPIQRLAWSQAGGFLLVQSVLIAAGRSGIHRFELGSGKSDPLVLTESGLNWNSHPRLSPDGNAFYYTHREFTPPDADNHQDWKDVIIRHDLRDHQEAIVHTPAEKLQIWWPFELSPDGTRMALITSDQRGTSDDEQFTVTIKEVSLSGGASRELVRMPPRENIVSAAWTPDGKRIVYIREPAGTGGKPNGPAEVWSVALDSGERVKARLSLPGLREIVIHPDGRQVALRTTSGVRYDIWVLEGLTPKLALHRASVPEN